MLRTRRRPRLDILEGRDLPAVIVNVDATADLHAIDPRIYGAAFASTAQLNDFRGPTNRWGGNTTSRYNWQQNAANHANDWYFQSLDEGSPTPGGAADALVQSTENAGADAIVTVPMVGWVAKLGPGRQRLASYSIAKYGAQTGNDWQWFPDAGNGIRASDGVKITWNNPNDANVAADENFQRTFVQHLEAKWGGAANSGVRYYALDNEPSIWHETQRDVHPNGAGMDEVRDKMLAYSGMIKSEDPAAYVMGPEEFGWSGFFLSGIDLKYGGETGDWGNLPDKKAHGGADSVPWMLQQLQAHDQTNGTRTLDAFTLHNYPQGGEFSDTVSQSMQLLRNRSTRQLWDPAYVDQSWIGTSGQPDGGIVRLIPRMRQWADSFYLPGTDIGITEYNWGAEGHMNGATTQADIWGIFGRHDLDLANRWTTPATGSPTSLAMKLWRNYNGAGLGFGDASARATVPNPDQVSAYVSRRSSDGALTVIVINKNLYDSANPNAKTAITVNLSHFASAGAAQQWQLAAVNPSNQTAATITQPGSPAITGNSFTFDAAKQSVNLFVIAPVIQPAPAVQASAVNDGSVQRSRVGSVTLTFSESVTLGADALTLRRTGLGGPAGVVPLIIDTSLSTPTQTVAKLTFGGAFAQDGSLLDGNYTLTAAGGLVLDSDGRGMSGDFTLNFHRLFGDADGDRDVDATDFGAFRQAFGDVSFAFDSDGDGDVDASDFGQFRQRFGASI